MAELSSGFNGRILSLDLLEAALDSLEISVRLDMIRNSLEIIGLPSCYSRGAATSLLPSFLVDQLLCLGVKRVTKTRVEDLIELIADAHRFNPFKEYLTATTWDGKDRLSELFKILGVEKERHRLYIQHWCLQVVALGLNDELQPIGADGVLVLQGSQGIGKTSVARVLCPRREWFVEGAVLDVRNKDSVMNATSGLITEIGELDDSLKKDQAALKSFLTAPVDRIRPPYGETIIETLRSTSFIATVNPSNFLRDDMGSRRFWVVPVEHINLDTLFSLSPMWIQQFWRQVYDLWKLNPGGFRLTAAERATLERENVVFKEAIPFEEEIREMLDFDLPSTRWEWWKATDFKQDLQQFDSPKVGRALMRINNDLFQGGQGGAKATKTVHGIKQYLLPRLHNCRF